MINYTFSNERNGQKATAYESMLAHAKDCLSKKEPEKAANAANVTYCKKAGEFTVKTLNKDVIINYPHFSAAYKHTQERLQWAWHIIILHYLRDADGTALANKPITFRMLEGGFARGRGYDVEISQIIARELSNKPIGAIKTAALSLGAELTECAADVCAKFWFLPRFPVTVQIWAPDEEMSGSGSMLLDESASHYLSVEDAIAAASIVYEQLKETVNRLI